jgi:ankyrin repeat protein
MPTRELPARPNLEHLKKQASTLLHDAEASQPEALARFEALNISKPKLADALHVIAREYGFDTWPQLKLHVESQSDKPLEALVAALKSNDAEALRNVLAANPSLRSHINDPLPNIGFEEPALLIATRKDNRALIDVLLDFGADINTRTQWWAGGFGVLDWGSPEQAEYLISRGAQLDIHSAARLGKLDRVRELLDHDPSLVHARGGDGQTPLHFAANVEIAQLLLDRGADIDVRDIDHESTAAQYAVCGNRMDVARLLLTRGAKPDIIMAAALGDAAVVTRMLDDDPDTIRITVNDRYFPKQNPRSGGTIYNFGFGFTKSPHILAREFNHPEVLQLLMQRTPLWLRLIVTAEANDAAGVKALLAAHPNLVSKVTPRAARRLIGVIIRNNTEAVRLLLEAGWPADAMMDTQQTALHFAAWHGNADIVRMLVARNVPLNIEEDEHKGTPLSWALHGSLNSWKRHEGDYPSVVRTLLAAGAHLPDRYPLEAAPGVIEIIQNRSKPV